MRILAALLALFLTTSAVAGERPSDLDARIAAFEKRTGVDLHLYGDRSEPAPDVKNDNIGPVDPELAAKLLDTIEEVLMAYQAPVRGGMVQEVYLLGQLKMRGKPFLGMARPKVHRLDLAIREGTTPDRLATTLHHEISHMIEGHPKFPRDQWVAISKADYAGDLSKAPKHKAATYLDQGFVTRYASRNRHEDFAEMAELAFTNPEKLRQLASKHEKIRSKMLLLTAVYQAVAPHTEEPWATPQILAAARQLGPVGGRTAGAAPAVALDDNGNPIRRRT